MPVAGVGRFSCSQFPSLPIILNRWNGEFYGDQSALQLGNQLLAIRRVNIHLAVAASQLLFFCMRSCRNRLCIGLSASGSPANGKARPTCRLQDDPAEKGTGHLLGTGAGGPSFSFSRDAHRR